MNKRRDNAEVRQRLDALREELSGKDAWGRDLLAPKILDAINAHATLGQLTGVFREAWGEYIEPSILKGGENMPQRIDRQLLRALTNVRRGENEQTLIERALGRGLLEKMSGRECSLLNCYEQLGGADPVVKAVLSGRLDEVFQQLPVLPGVEAAREAVLSPIIPGAAAAKGAELRGNVLARIEGQVLKTLADLGGPEFRVKFNLED